MDADSSSPVIPKDKNHEIFIKQDITSLFGSAYLVSAYCDYPNAQLLDGFVAVVESRIAGILLFCPVENRLELVYLHALESGKGIAKQLINEFINFSKLQKINAFVITTNDNIDAIKLYQQVGFRAIKIHTDLMDKVRLKKPMIPKIGNHGIVLQDMIEFQYVIDPISHT